MSAMLERANWLRSEGRWVGNIVLTANTRRGNSVHVGYQLSTGGWRTLCGGEISFGKQTTADLSCKRCVSGMRLNNVVDPSCIKATPTTPGSVVWLQGHPWVLDGGTSRSRYTQRWIGVHKDGSIGSLSMQQMDRLRPGIVYEHTDDDSLS